MNVMHQQKWTRESFLVAVRLKSYSRPGAGDPWTEQTIEEFDAAVQLTALGIELPLREIYDGVELPGPTA